MRTGQWGFAVVLPTAARSKVQSDRSLRSGRSTTGLNQETRRLSPRAPSGAEGVARGRPPRGALASGDDVTERGRTIWSGANEPYGTFQACIVATNPRTWFDSDSLLHLAFETRPAVECRLHRAHWSRSVAGSSLHPRCADRTSASGSACRPSAADRARALERFRGNPEFGFEGRPSGSEVAFRPAAVGSCHGHRNFAFDRPLVASKPGEKLATAGFERRSAGSIAVVKATSASAKLPCVR